MRTAIAISRWIVILGVVLLSVFYIGAQFLPSRAQLERVIEIDAPPEAVWPLISDFERWRQWSPWSARDAGMAVEISGEPGVVGHMMRWRSDDPSVGAGEQRVTDADAPGLFATALDFGEMGTAEAVLEVAPTDEGSRVTWRFSSDLEGADQRWFGLMLDGFLGPEYERGLAALKAVVEGPSAEE